jgi:hypothetical protein
MRESRVWTRLKFGQLKRANSNVESDRLDVLVSMARRLGSALAAEWIGC